MSHYTLANCDLASFFLETKYNGSVKINNGYSAVRNRRGVVINGGLEKSLKLNSRGVVIIGGVEKLT